MSNPVLANIMDTWFGDRYFMHGYTYQRDYSYIAAMGWVYLLFIIIIAAIIFAAWGKASRTGRRCRMRGTRNAAAVSRTLSSAKIPFYIGRLFCTPAHR